MCRGHVRCRVASEKQIFGRRRRFFPLAFFYHVAGRFGTVVVKHANAVCSFAV